MNHAMKVCILAGGVGTRLQEETTVKPKPMVEIGGRPILWHILKIYATFGYREFLIALGYKGECIKDYFLNYCQLNNDVSVSLDDGQVTVHRRPHEPWIVHLIDTGLDTQTGGRLKRLAPYLDQRPFMMTYGDGVADVDLDALLAFHRQQRRLVTITAVRPPARFGSLDLDGSLVSRFGEKSQTSEGWINGGFFVLEPEVLRYIETDETIFEREPLEQLARDRQLLAFLHRGFWQCMDTLRDVQLLEGLWQRREAPWRVWP